MAREDDDEPAPFMTPDGELNIVTNGVPLWDGRPKFIRLKDGTLVTPDEWDRRNKPLPIGPEDVAPKSD